MKVKELVKELNKYMAQYGDDLEIIVSHDEEGNCYGTIDKQSLSLVLDNPEGGSNKPVGVVIYPWEEGIEYAEEACAISRECGHHPYCNNGEGCDTCKVYRYKR